MSVSKVMLIKLKDDAMRARSRIFFFFCTIPVFVLSACGGGSSDSAPKPTTPPIVTPPEFSLKITEETLDVLALGPSYAESILQLGDAASTHLIEYVKSVSPPETLCALDSEGERGVLSFSHTDIDGDWFLEPEETMTLNYANCDAQVLGEVLDGTIALKVAELSYDANGNFSIVAELSTSQLVITSDNDTDEPEDDYALTIDAQFTISVEINDADTVSISTNDNDFFEVELDGVVERITDFSMSKVTNSDEVINVLFDVSIDSEVMGGTYRCIADESIPFQYQNAQAGLIVCNGDSSSARILNELVAIDENGNGEYSDYGKVSWGVIFEDYFVRNYKRLKRSSQAFVPVGLGRLSVGSRAVFQDAGDGNIFLFTTETDPDYPNSLISIDVQTKEVSLLRDFADLDIGDLSISEDRTQYCFALEGNDVLSCFSMDTHTEAFSITVNYTHQHSYNIDGLPASICKIYPASKNTGLYAIKMRKEGYDCLDIILVDNGSQLPITFNDMASDYVLPSFLVLDAQLVFADNDSKIYLSSASSWVNGANVMQLSLGANGFENLLPLDANWSGRDYKVIDNQLYGARFKYDLNELYTMGEYRHKDEYGYEVYYNARLVDTDSNKIFIAEDDRIVVYDSLTFNPISEFALDLDGNFDDVIGMATTQSDLIVSTNLWSIAIPLEALSVEPTGLCSTDDESEQYLAVMLCGVTDAVYDSERNLIYGIVNNRAGSMGNALKVINPDTFEVIESVYIGSEPTKIALSADNDSAFIMFMEGLQVKQVDLEDYTVDDRFVLKAEISPDQTELSSGEIIDSDVSSEVEDAFVVAVQMPWEQANLHIYQQGASNKATVFDFDVSTVLFRPDGKLQIFNNYTQYRTINYYMDLYIVLTEEMGDIQSVDDSTVRIGSSEAIVAGNTVYTSFGAVIDLESFTGEYRFNIPGLASAVGMNNDNTQIFFAKEDSIDESVRLQLIGFDVASGEAFATVGAQDVDGNARLDASVLYLSETRVAAVSKRTGALVLFNLQ